MSRPGPPPARLPGDGHSGGGALPAEPRSRGPSLPVRSVRLHLASRRAPAALVALATCAAGLQAALWWHADRGSIQVPLIVEAAAAAIVSVATTSPFGEAEQASGRRLSYLRLVAAMSLTAAAVVALTAGAAGETLLGGAAALVRDTAGMVGVGLVAAGLVGGAFSWVGPMAYLALAEVALSSGWHTPWTWPARPPDDAGGAVCAAVLFGAGLMAAALRGSRAIAAEGGAWSQPSRASVAGLSRPPWSRVVSAERARRSDHG